METQMQSAREKVILKLQNVYKHRFLGRGYQKYNLRFEGLQNGQKQYYNEKVNCFEHAFFNLSNEKLSEIFVEDGVLDEEALEQFWEFNIKPEKTVNENLEPLLDFVKKSGLKLEKCDEMAECKDNQWKVAVYYRERQGDVDEDFHFMRSEKEGIWTSKDGKESRVEQYFELPVVFKNYKTTYKLVDVFMVTHELEKEAELTK